MAQVGRVSRFVFVFVSRVSFSATASVLGSLVPLLSSLLTCSRVSAVIKACSEVFQFHLLRCAFVFCLRFTFTFVLFAAGAARLLLLLRARACAFVRACF